MASRCMLIPTASGIDPTRRLDAALKLGKRIGAHVRILFTSPEPHKFLSALPEVVRAAGVTVASLEREVHEAAAIGRAALDSWCTQKGVKRTDTGDRLDAVFATWDEEVGDLEALLALAGRISDVTIVDQPDGSKQFTERAFDAAVFSTGRPVLVIPARVPNDLLRHVVIAWNGSLEAARVIGQSIELLHEAERVSIIHVEGLHVQRSPFLDLADYLRWHGIVAHSLPMVGAGHASSGEAILVEAARDDATMLVMGAYTHSRIPHFLLGGVTRHVLEHAAIPVLMSH